MNLCECGCSKETKPGRRFIRGHNAKGKNHPFFGKKNHDHSERMKGENNPMFGKKRPDISERNRKMVGEKHPFFGRKRPDISGENHPLFGKKCPEISKRQKGENNSMFGVRRFGKDAPMFGKHHSEETKKKQRDAKLGENNHNYGKKNPGLSARNRKLTGESNPNWNPNREEVLRGYTKKFYDKKFRKQILFEQKYICPICNRKLSKGKIDFHHIDSNKQNDNKENLVFLHSHCHNKTKGSLENRNYWKRKLKKKN